MEISTVASFEVTAWEQGEPEGNAPTLSTAVVRKRYSGSLAGDGKANLMMCQADLKDMSAGAGYIASEVVNGILQGRSGGFVMHHWGTSVGGSKKTGGHIVPGSGTGELAGLTGTVEISVDDEGAHSLKIECDLPDS